MSATQSERPAPLPTCTAKHTKFQPVEAEWKCPKCGAPACPKEPRDNAFIVNDSPEGSDWNCTALHDEDSLGCGCGYGTSGKAFAARLQKAANMVPCPTCKGHGLVKGGA